MFSISASRQEKDREQLRCWGASIPPASLEMFMDNNELLPSSTYTDFIYISHINLELFCWGGDVDMNL